MSQILVTGEAKVRDIQGPVVANSGVITALDGDASQYVRGDGTLADFPTSSGGGSSVSYYLNSSVSQGTIGGVAYRELSKEPIIGAGTDIAISANGYVASYLTDANDPDVLSIPGGNFNCEFYFSVNNNTGNPFFYAELYKYDGTTFTLLGSSVGVPEYINQGTIIAPYYFAIPVPTSALALTDRLAIRIYVNVDGRTVTLHTENGHLCQVVTTLSKGMVSLNNLTDQSQFLTTGTSGTNFNIASSGDTHTFNLPIASATNTGKLSSTDWSVFNNKQAALSFTAPLDNTSNTISIPAASDSVDGYLDNLDWTKFNTAYNDSIISAAVTGTTTKTLTLNQQDGGTITASWTDDNTDAVTSVFGRTGAVVAVSGDYNTSQVTENTNLYFTDARARAAISLTTTGTSGAATYNNTTGVFNIPNYGSALSGYVPYTGATTAVNLGANNLSAKVGSFTDGQTYNTLISADPAGGYVQTYRFSDGFSYPFSIYAGSGTTAFKSFTLNNTGATLNTTLFGTSALFSSSIEATSVSGTSSLIQQWSYNGASTAYRLQLNTIVTSGLVKYSFDLTNNSTSYPSNLVLDRGNIGIGISPAAWNATYKVLQFNNSSIYGDNATSPSTYYGNNYFVNSAGNGIYLNSASAGALGMEGNSLVFYNAPTGTAGGAATLSERFRITGGGNLLVGTTTDNGNRLQVSGAATFSSSVTAAQSKFWDGTQGLLIGAYSAGSGFGAIYPSTVTPSSTNHALAASSGATVLNTGSSGIIDLEINAVSALYISNSRNVGIGTSSPDASDWNGSARLLHIYQNTTNGSVIKLESSNASGILAAFNDAMGVGTLTNDPLLFYTNVTERMRITSGGSIGINNTNPLNTAWGTDATTKQLSINGSGYGVINITGAQGGTARTYSMGVGDNYFYMAYDNTLNTHCLVINNGNVLVKNTAGISGGGALQVNGNVNINGLFQINGVTIGGGGGSGVTGSGTTGYHSKWTSASSLGNSVIYDNGSFVGIGTASPTELLHINNGGGVAAFIRLQGTGGGGVYIGNRSDNMELYAGNAERMRLTSGGNVLIGTITDNGSKLQVTGTATINGLLNTTTSNGIISGGTSFAFAPSSTRGCIHIVGSTDSLLSFGQNGSQNLYIYSGPAVSSINTTFNLSVNVGGSERLNISASTGASTFYSSVTATGGFFDTSDSRLKILVKDYEQPKGIENVAARMYVKNSKQELGYFAQDLQEILPSAVIEGEDGFLNLSYSQVHTAKIAYLENKVAQLEELIKSLL
jgi:hypothetical protein